MLPAEPDDPDNQDINKFERRPPTKQTKTTRKIVVPRRAFGTA
jgi:hypothetical protein